jgi:hypothetical protein
MGENSRGSFRIDFADVPSRCPILYWEANGGNGGSSSEIFCTGRTIETNPQSLLIRTGSRLESVSVHPFLFSLPSNSRFYRVKS